MLRRTTLASLSCHVVDSGSAQPPELVVILCHGFGAPGDDLVSLGPELLQHPALHQGVRFVFPAAPHDLGPYGFGAGRAWWLVTTQQLLAIHGGDPAGLEQMRRSTPEGLPQARRLLMGLVAEISTQTGLPNSRIVLGGFSQGAMLATDVALRLEEAPAGLCVLSGTLLCSDEWKARAARRTDLPVFQSHGRQDPILGITSAEALRDLLVGAGLSVEFFPFDGGHTIGLEELNRMASFLQARLQGVSSKAS